ncbi:Peroxidase 21 [Camellia lanceoleosa]|uniref:Peroxidase 21 n=1 Tax=Camellia lanceoleosa TaxID=1840588 RepID=A0ACC0HQ78_9ERIC|nr:Peroxidase 21 [Camellia lanceoleosa]
MLIFRFLFLQVKADLQFNFYNESCPRAEEIIKEEVTKLYKQHGNTAISWIRNLFHDCMVKSCDASLLLESKYGILSEKTSDRSFGMRNFKYMETIKNVLESQCSMTVSCADIVALSARDGVGLLGGPHIEMKTGRKDSRESYALVVDEFIPNHNDTMALVLSRFQSIGIDAEGTVALLGAHSVGRVHCVNLVDRLYPTVDPTLDPDHAEYLKRRCPSPEPDPKAVQYARNDLETPMVLDNVYYKHLLEHKGLLLVDQQLVSDPTTLPFVTKMAADNGYFHDQFSRAFLLLVAGATQFDFETLTLTSLKLLGDAHLNNGSVRLTRDLAVPNSGAGRALYSKPIRFRQPVTHFPASFSTFFSFSVTNLNPSSIGGGLAFLISPDDSAVGDGGAYLGLMNQTGGPIGTVAVEFDTLMDVQFMDINGNHVGLDLNSMVSTKIADLESIDVDLKSGDLVNSWIDYSGSTRIFNISVSYSNLKPEAPLLSFTLDLDQYVSDFMYVGFSGSTQGSTEIHSINWWSFSSNFELFSSGFTPKIQNLKNSDPLTSEIIKMPKEFSYKELKSATKCFNSARIIGHGAFGTVYRDSVSDLNGMVTISSISSSSDDHSFNGGGGGVELV